MICEQTGRCGLAPQSPEEKEASVNPTAGGGGRGLGFRVSGGTKATTLLEPLKGSSIHYIGTRTLRVQPLHTKSGVLRYAQLENRRTGKP